MTASTPVVFNGESETTTEPSIMENSISERTSTIDINKEKMDGGNEKSLSDIKNDKDSKENTIDSLEKDFEDSLRNVENEKNSILLSSEVATTETTPPQSTIEIENAEDDETTETAMMTTTKSTEISDIDDETSKKSEAKNAEELENKNISEGFDTETERKETTISSLPTTTTEKALEDSEPETIIPSEIETTTEIATQRHAEMSKALQQIRNFLRAYAARWVMLMFNDSRKHQMLPLTSEPQQSSSHIAETFIRAPSHISSLQSQRADENENVSSGDTQRRQFHNERDDDEVDEMTMTSKLQQRRQKDVSWNFLNLH